MRNHSLIHQAARDIWLAGYTIPEYLYERRISLSIKDTMILQAEWMRLDKINAKHPIVEERKIK